MSIAKKGTRRICVDGVDFLWKLTFNWEEFQRLMRITVERAESAGSKLLIYPIAVDVNYVDFNRGDPITPKTVETFIQRALKDGWNPAEPGPAFVLGRPERQG